MGSGETGTVNAPANQAGNAHHGGAARSADSAAQSEFAKAFSQEAQTPACTDPTALTPREEALQQCLPENERHLPPPFSQKSDGGSRVQGGGTKTPSKGASSAVADSKTADAPARDSILSQDATGLKPGERINATVTTKEDITNPNAEMSFDFSKPITKDQAAAILFQQGKVPEGATLTQGKGNQWIVQYRNNIDTKQNVLNHMNSHTESVLTRSRLPGEMFPPERNLTYSWVGGEKAFNTTKEGPPRRDLKNDLGFVITRRYALDEGQSPHMNVRRLVKPGPGYEVVFDKPKTRDQVKDTFFDKGVHKDQVRLIPVPQEPTAIWQVQMLDSEAPLKTPAARALQDSNVYAKEAVAPGLPDGVKAHIQNQTVPPDAKRFEFDVQRQEFVPSHRGNIYIWEQEGHIVRVETNGKKGDAGYYKYEQTKLYPAEQSNDMKQSNDTMRWLMLEKGLPVRKAWQEHIKHWDELHRGMLGMVSGAYNMPGRPPASVPTPKQPRPGPTRPTGPSKAIQGGGETTTPRQGHLTSVDPQGNLQVPSLTKRASPKDPTPSGGAKPAGSPAANENVAVVPEANVQKVAVGQNLPLPGSSTKMVRRIVTQPPRNTPSNANIGAASPTRSSPASTEQTIGVRGERRPEGTQKISKTPDPQTKSLSDGEMLHANMEKAGRPVPPGHDAHHIVPKKGGGTWGDKARAEMDRLNLKINDGDNGVALPGSRRDAPRGTVPEPEGGPYHGTMHTEPYFKEVAQRLRDARNEAEGRRVLRGIEQDIKNGNFPH
jgi:hypothetical protein